MLGGNYKVNMMLKFSRKTLLVFFKLSLCINVNCLAQNNTLMYDSLRGFNGFTWGNSSQFIRNEETSKYMQTSLGFSRSVVSFSDEIEGFDSRIDYVFKEDELIEGSYTFNNVEDIQTIFSTMQEMLRNKYGKPDFWATAHINSKNIWKRVNNYGLFRGPELYWQFENGFIVLHSSKYVEDITLSIIYVHNKTIEQFSEDNLLPVELFLIEE